MNQMHQMHQMHQMNEMNAKRCRATARHRFAPKMNWSY
ncbi:hypothetical protein M2272_001364 [Mycobacterium frederiksbergense]|uniref:Uncharacterized protein n=1 Tax=Mycolicibacterium frederiksbergense TaxID=117567 RepID=A0ABT6KY20_9MYCO|nr:hypothetical protein [Mycolicibacterium frederiksbergense]